MTSWIKVDMADAPKCHLFVLNISLSRMVLINVISGKQDHNFWLFTQKLARQRHSCNVPGKGRRARRACGVARSDEGAERPWSVVRSDGKLSPDAGLRQGRRSSR